MTYDNDCYRYLYQTVSVYGCSTESPTIMYIYSRLVYTDLRVWFKVTKITNLSTWAWLVLCSDVTYERVIVVNCNLEDAELLICEMLVYLQKT